jgi:hypothetical protein
MPPFLSGLRRTEGESLGLSLYPLSLLGNDSLNTFSRQKNAEASFSMRSMPIKGKKVISSSQNFLFFFFQIQHIQYICIILVVLTVSVIIRSISHEILLICQPVKCYHGPSHFQNLNKTHICNLCRRVILSASIQT